MLICPEKKIIFFKPMKCAGTSVESTLLSCINDPNSICAGSSDIHAKLEYGSKNNVFKHQGIKYKKFNQHCYPELFYNRLYDTTLYQDYHHVSIVRNPYDALVSYYWYTATQAKVQLDAGQISQERYESLLITESDFSDKIKEKFQRTLTLANDYRDDEMAHEIGIAGQLASPLIYFSMINSSFLDHRVTTYLRYESLNCDFLELCSSLKIGKPKLHRHKVHHRNLNIHYSVYFNEMMKEEVQYYFGDYIEKFGYEFNCGM